MAVMGNPERLTNKFFDLKFVSSSLQWWPHKCDKEENEQKLRVKKTFGRPRRGPADAPSPNPGRPSPSCPAAALLLGLDPAHVASATSSCRLPGLQAASSPSPDSALSGVGLDTRHFGFGLTLYHFCFAVVILVSILSHQFHAFCPVND